MAVYNWTLGTDPNWKARYRVTCAGLHVKTHDRYIRLAQHGALLDWLNPEQEAHFLKMGLVERIPEDEQAAIADAPVEVEADEDEYAPAPEQSGAVDECLATLAHLQVPPRPAQPCAMRATASATTSSPTPSSGARGSCPVPRRLKMKTQSRSRS
jgi:hypothetical protein